MIFFLTELEQLILKFVWRHKRWQNGQNYLEKEEKNLMYYTPSCQAILQSCNSENSTVLSKTQKNKNRHIYLWNGMHACSALSNSLWPHGLYQAPLSMGFSRQECWSGLLFPYLGDLLNLEIEPVSLVSPALAGGFFTTEPPGKPIEQNREPRNKPMLIWSINLWQRRQEYTVGKKAVFFPFH